MKILVTFWLCLFGLNAFSGELNGIKLPDATTIDGKELVLNGMALRIVEKFMIPVKVYVGALYLEKKSSDWKSIVENGETKKLVMHFVRPVDREALLESYGKSYEDACTYACDKLKSQFAEFAKYLVAVRRDNEISLTFYKDKLVVETDGPNAKKGEILDADLSKNMLTVFINDKVKGVATLRKGFLGL